ncbi:hypothetical protein BJY04DRAFT_217462 [Aspergillus karnatakaensis]|uniref:uncharacterized protein n=1 Tax=Aspergillus karnatakaensis TaxID=1810916 RepID=UPI003CCE02CF
MLSLTRLGARAVPEARQECVMLVRVCPSTLRIMLQQAGFCENLDLYSIALSWVVPLFTLRSTYLLFNHIVNVAYNYIEILKKPLLGGTQKSQGLGLAAIAGDSETVRYP